MYCKGIFSEFRDWNLFAQDIAQWWATVVELRVTWNGDNFLNN